MPIHIAKEGPGQSSTTFRRLAKGHLLLGDLHTVDEVAHDAIQEVHGDAFPPRGARGPDAGDAHDGRVCLRADRDRRVGALLRGGDVVDGAGLPDAFRQTGSDATAVLHVEEDLVAIDLLPGAVTLAGAGAGAGCGGRRFRLTPEDLVVDLGGGQLLADNLEHLFGLTLGGRRGFAIDNDHVAFVEARSLVDPARRVGSHESLAQVNPGRVHIMEFLVQRGILGVGRDVFHAAGGAGASHLVAQIDLHLSQRRLRQGGRDRGRLLLLVLLGGVDGGAHAVGVDLGERGAVIGAGGGMMGGAVGGGRVAPILGGSGRLFALEEGKGRFARVGRRGAQPWWWGGGWRRQVIPVRGALGEEDGIPTRRTGADGGGGFPDGILDAGLRLVGLGPRQDASFLGCWSRVVVIDAPKRSPVCFHRQTARREMEVSVERKSQWGGYQTIRTA